MSQMQVDHQLQNSGSKYKVNYDEVNEFGGSNASDEEEDIELEHKDKNSRSNNQNERTLRAKYAKTNDAYEYPNFFEAQKTKAKITPQEEDIGKKILLQSDKKEKQKKGKASSLKFNAKKNYKSEAEDDDDKHFLTMIENEENLNSVLEDVPIKHDQEKKDLLKRIQDVDFPKMKFFLECGFNLLVYGVGSKRNLINQFVVQQIACSSPYVIINGYHTGVNLKAVLAPISEYVSSQIEKGINKNKRHMSIHDECEHIKMVFNSMMKQDTHNTTKLYVIIHSMDLQSLKNEEWQNYLSEIASLNGIRFIVSVDHIKSAAMWNDQMIDRFNFYSFQLDTFQEYDCENDYLPNVFIAKNDNQEIGLNFILQSMTSHQRQAIRLIAEYQLQNPQEKGIKFKELMNKCVENMVAYNQKALKDYLHEAKDHKVVLERTDEQGFTYLYMNYPVLLLEKIVADIKLEHEK